MVLPLTWCIDNLGICYCCYSSCRMFLFTCFTFADCCLRRPRGDYSLTVTYYYWYRLVTVMWLPDVFHWRYTHCILEPFPITFTITLNLLQTLIPTGLFHFHYCWYHSHYCCSRVPDHLTTITFIDVLSIDYISICLLPVYYCYRLPFTTLFIIVIPIIVPFVDDYHFTIPDGCYINLGVMPRHYRDTGYWWHSDPFETTFRPVLDRYHPFLVSCSLFHLLCCWWQAIANAHPICFCCLLF